MNQKISEVLATLTDRPGVYMMKSADGAVIYVGKAKNLKNRVKSYFLNAGGHDVKTEALVSNIDEIEYIITASEHEAFILENSLIKKHRPRYNIMFKDDKTYPFIKLTVNEEWPRAVLSRRVESDGAQYFGPFSDQWSVRVIIKMAQDIYNIRSCNLNLTVPRKKPCLQYHIGRCVAPCVRYISEIEYSNIVDRVREFIKGDYDRVIENLNAAMKKAAAEFKFEKAAVIRDQIRAIENISKKQNIVCADLLDRDIIVEAKGTLIDVIEVFCVRRGVLLGHSPFVIEGDKVAGIALLDDFAQRYYSQDAPAPDEVITSSALSPQTTALIAENFKNSGRKTPRFITAYDSAQTELIAMAHKNALNTLKIREAEIADKSVKSRTALAEIQKALKLGGPPARIECYDISNISGTLAVGSMVVAINGSMQKSEYRKFKIKTVDKIDDYMMMKEVLRRRFTRAMNEGQTLPDLVMIDGGLGHLSAACEAMSSIGLNGKVALCSIAKQNEDIYEPANPLPVFLNKKSQGQYLLMRIRDEAHRFAISYHKKLRKGKMTLSLLSSIKGLGKTRISSLYDHFETIERIRAASVDELTMVSNINRPIAQKIYDYFHESEKNAGEGAPPGAQSDSP